jgi:hypothetical protein
MRPIDPAPYALLVVSALALATAMWFAVRSAPQRVGRKPAWQTGQACFAALSATLAAFCVLGAVALLT